MFYVWTRCFFNLVVVTFVFSGEQKRQLPKFGREMRSEFYLKPDFIQLNHGAHGINPKVVLQSMWDYQKRIDCNPDLWYEHDVRPELAKVRREIGQLINADSEDIVMVPNVSSGFNAILRSITFAAGDRILHWSTLYNAVSGVVRFILDFHKGAVTTLVFNVVYPMRNEEVVAKLENFLQENDDSQKPIRIAIIDHISAKPTIINPIEQIIPLLKKRNIMVAVDGAHAIGQIPINTTGLDPDFYVTNAHKWLFTPRNSAVLYVKKKHQPHIHPAIVGRWYQNPGDFQKEFWWIGTYDHSHFLAVLAALQFRRDVGGEDAIMEYNNNLAYRAGQLIAKRFGTRVLQYDDQRAAMVDIQLPVDNPDDPKLYEQWWIDEQLLKHPNTFLPVYKHNGVWWARYSAQIYNDITDFEKGAQHFIDICSELTALQNTTSGKRVV